MFRTKLIPATIAAVIALGTASAGFASSGEDENSKEVSAVLNAGTSISQAIAAAEKRTSGRAIKAGVEHEKGVYLYEIKTVSKNKVSEVFVDPASGKIARTDDRGFIAKIFDSEDQAEFAKLAASSVTLGTAIAIAEKETGGYAIEATFENEHSKMLFEVKVAMGKAVSKVVVDAASGNVVRVSTAEEGEHNED